MEKSLLKIETKVVHGSKGYDPITGSVSFPIYQSATFKHRGLNMSTGYDYSRSQNPTREELENTIASLECGKAGFAFSSGMSAISAVLTLFSNGDHIIVSDDLYGGTYRIFEQIYKKYGIEASYVDTTCIDEILKYIKPNTKAFFIETPSNPMMKVTDIKKVADIAKIHSAITIVDNTFLSPYFQRPLTLGADIVVHSGTKFLCGHNDTLAGFVVTNNDDIKEKIKSIQMSVGSVLSPFDSWLTLRGIKTLAVRMDRAQENAKKISKWLNISSKVDKVYYVGLPDHPQYDISLRQTTGFGSMISFCVKDIDTVKEILNSVKVVSFAESLGGVESLITYPYTQTHADIPDNIKERLGITDKLLRLSVGIENSDDIISDLEWAMR